MPKIIFILFIIFWSFPIQIYSISGTEEELFPMTDTDNTNKVDPKNVCPCDLTDACDQCCYCDKDCSTQILYYDYVNVCGEGDSSSYVRQNIDENLEYCNDFKKTLDELYNPLVLGFQILKRGLCLYKNKNGDKNDDNNESKNDDNNSEEGTKETPLDFSSFFPISKTGINEPNCKDFQRITINATMALPSGFCLFGAFPVTCLINYEVSCTYPDSKSENVNEYKDEIIRNYNISATLNNYYIYENYYFNTTPYGDNYIKKIEIIIYVNNSINNIGTTDITNIDYNIYYGKKNSIKKYLDFTQTVTFLNGKSDYLRSGSPGYIKGKPILLGKLGTLSGGSEQKYVNKLKPNLIIPLLGDSNSCPISKLEDEENNGYYYDNYLDNMLTFEDTIIFSCKNPNPNENVIQNPPIFVNLNKDSLFGKFGNAYMEYTDSWTECINTPSNDNIYKFPILYVDYIYQGAVNSSLFFIQQMDYTHNSNVDINNENYIYFIVKSLTPYEHKTKIWTAQPPGILKLPRNIMYPFRTQTTTYKTKS